MDMVWPPGIVAGAPRICARLDRGKPIPTVIHGEDAALAVEIRIGRGVVPVRRMLIAAGGIGLPDLDDGSRYRPAILVGDTAANDDALAEGRFAVDHR